MISIKNVFKNFLSSVILLEDSYKQRMHVDVTTSESVIEQSKFLNITSDENGGAISVSGRVKFSIRNCYFFRCVGAKGGCLYSESEGFHSTFSHNCINECYAKSSGNCIYIETNLYSSFLDNFSTIHDCYDKSLDKQTSLSIISAIISDFYINLNNYTRNCISESPSSSYIVLQTATEGNLKFTTMSENNGAYLIYFIGSSLYGAQQCLFRNSVYDNGYFLVSSSNIFFFSECYFMNMTGYTFNSNCTDITLLNCVFDCEIQSETFIKNESSQKMDDIVSLPVEYVSIFDCYTQYVNSNVLNIKLILYIALISGSLAIGAISLFIGMNCSSWICCCCLCREPCCNNRCCMFCHELCLCDEQHCNVDENCYPEDFCDRCCCCKQGECCECCCRTWAWYWCSHPFWCNTPRCAELNQVYCKCGFIHTPCCECWCKPCYYRVIERGIPPNEQRVNHQSEIEPVSTFDNPYDLSPYINNDIESVAASQTLPK